jgi:bifunctional non-homologous end joining protein LigD
VVVPLTPRAGWDDVKAFAKGMADAMAAERPERYTATSVKRERQGRIYVDYLRNGRGATAIAPYSTRARPGAPIAVPVAWEELSPALKPNQFTLANLPARLARLKRDPWKDIGKVDQALPERSRATRGKRRRA